MKKRFIFRAIIVSLIATFVFAEIFNLYHFGDIPTILSTSYLLAIFSIFTDIILSIIYLIDKKVKKEKIGIKKVIALFLLFISLILVNAFIVILNIDWLNWYAYSTPFYINVIIRSLEVILPAIILISVGIKLFQKK